MVAGMLPRLLPNSHCSHSFAHRALCPPATDSFPVGTLVGHTDAVWDIAIVDTGSGPARAMSVSADGTLRVWKLRVGLGELVCVVSWSAPPAAWTHIANVRVRV